MKQFIFLLLKKQKTQNFLKLVAMKSKTSLMLLILSVDVASRSVIVVR